MVAFVLSVPYTLGLLLGFAVSDTGRVVFTSAFLVSLLLATSFPVVCGFLLPRVGVDWDPTGYGASTYLLLGAGGVWYALVFLVPLTLVSVVYSL